MEVFSWGSCHTPKLQDVTMAMESRSSQYIQKGDLNATIEGFNAFVALQESEMMRWSDLHNEGIFKYFIKNSEMTITKFHKQLMLVPFNEIHLFRLVRELSITKCDSLDEVFESIGGMVTKKGYPTTNYELQSMKLENLPKLRCIWVANITRLVRFDNLTSIKIEGCDNLKTVLSHSMARSLVQLKEMRVEGCKMIKKIVTKEDDNRDGCSKVMTLFPKLEILELQNLPKLECVCSGDYDYDIPLCNEEDKEISNEQVQISFPQLHKLSLEDVPSIQCFCPGAYDYELMLSSSCIEKSTQVTTFPNGNVIVSTPNLYKICVGKLQSMWELIPMYISTLGDLNLTLHYIRNSKKYKVELQKLETLACIEQHQYQHLLAYITRETSLELDSCDKLLNCFPSNMMHLFHHLEALRVQECKCLEEIFESSGYEGRMELFRLELYSLPKLKHIWGNHGPIFGFQKMSHLIISKCHDLKFVFADISVARSLPRLSQLVVSECNKMEEIILNDNNNNYSIPKGAKIIFPALLFIELYELPKLKCFCPSSSYFELPLCGRIDIKGCPKMEIFCPTHTMPMVILYGRDTL